MRTRESPKQGVRALSVYGLGLRSWKAWRVAESLMRLCAWESSRGQSTCAIEILKCLVEGIGRFLVRICVGAIWITKFQNSPVPIISYLLLDCF